MHGPNHGCPKCVINDGFIGPIAELLAFTVGAKHELYKPAMDLAVAANAATKVFAHATSLDVRTMPAEHKFTGCREAATLMRYIGKPDDYGAEAAEALVAMRADILDQITDIVSNKDGTRRKETE